MFDVVSRIQIARRVIIHQYEPAAVKIKRSPVSSQSTN